MNDVAARLAEIVRRIEHTDVLDAPAAVITPAVRRMTRVASVKRVLSGAPVGHRLHPMLTDVPIGSWTSASVLDLLGGRAARPAARRLVALGIVAAIPTAASGLSDWEDTHGGTRRVGVVHAVANSLGTVLQVASWSARRRDHHVRGAVLGAVSLGVLTAAGYLGGHLVFAARVGVDHPVPVARPGRWLRACRYDDLVDGQPLGVEIDGAKVVVVRDLGQVHALAATCTHAGGPLDDGRVVGGAVECPWHGSRFCLADGRVERGPAASAAPRYDVRVRDGAVEVRLADEPAVPAETATPSASPASPQPVA